MSENKYLNAAASHFKALPIQEIVVPEWVVDGTPLKIFWRQRNVLQDAKIFADGMDNTRFVDVVIMLARDASDRPMFTLEDKQALLRAVDPEIIKRIALAMLKAPSIEQAEKN